jgi:lipopolysaccharide/colanic/teichoic acid biosynthesis glycosyltransferase
MPFEVDHFQPYHFERFSVPAGMTGLWQVTARARSTFVEALDMDVAYARDCRSASICGSSPVRRCRC